MFTHTLTRKERFASKSVCVWTKNKLEMFCIRCPWEAQSQQTYTSITLESIPLCMVALKLGQIHHTGKKVLQILQSCPFFTRKKVNYINFLDCKRYRLTFLIKIDILCDGIFSQIVVIVCKQSSPGGLIHRGFVLVRTGPNNGWKYLILDVIFPGKEVLYSF